MAALISTRMISAQPTCTVRARVSKPMVSCAVLATLLTNDRAAMCRRLSALAAIRERDALVRRVVAGIHIEGPFLNESDGYRGAHPRDALPPADAGAMAS